MSAVFLAVLLAQAPIVQMAGAEPTPEMPRRRMVTLFTGVDLEGLYGCGYYGNCGVPVALGARFGFSALRNGFVPVVNDSLDVELGADVRVQAGHRTGWGVTPLVELRWTLYFSNRVAAYLKGGLGAGVFLGTVSPVRVHYDAGAGVLIALTEHLILRAEGGYGGVKAGVAYAF